MDCSPTSTPFSTPLAGTPWDQPVRDASQRQDSVLGWLPASDGVLDD